MTEEIVPGSFRDPAGYLFVKNNILYRRIQPSYRENYTLLIRSGLYEKLTKRNLLVPHQEITTPNSGSSETCLDIRPEPIPFISYPYEWSFSQLKDAALLTLEIQKESLSHGMILKDASAYNVQFFEGHPLFIDTLSFERYEDGKPWKAFKQFCEHFLAPLALMSLRDIRLSQLLKVHMDGIPLDLASNLLPKRTYLKFGLLFHIHIHAWTQRRYSKSSTQDPSRRRVGKERLLAIVASLTKAVKELDWRPVGTEWARYYLDDHNYSMEDLEEKAKILSDFLDEFHPRTVWDLGSNTGYFSRIATLKGMDTISFDSDPACVELNYHETKKNNETNLLPLLLDLTNPSPAIGWDNRERIGLLDRKKPDLVFALALIHHLAISNNLPLPRIASYFSNMAKGLIIEFVPKTDSMVTRMLATREDIFPNYNQDGFETAFKKYFSIKKSKKITNTERTLYLMVRREDV